MGFSDFKEGDIVYLKIGSPVMMINKKDAHNCECLYFYNGEVKTTKINYACLTKDKPNN